MVGLGTLYNDYLYCTTSEMAKNREENAIDYLRLPAEVVQNLKQTQYFPAGNFFHAGVLSVIQNLQTTAEIIAEQIQNSKSNFSVMRNIHNGTIFLIELTKCVSYCFFYCCVSALLLVFLFMF